MIRTIFNFTMLAAVWAGAAFGVSSGAPEGSTGAPNEETCIACHGGAANSGPGRLRIEFGSASYTPGEKVRMRVVIEDPNARRWGFQLTARPESGPQSSLGRLETVNNQAQILRAGVLEWITHTLSGTRLGASSPVTFEFDWTAPASDVGPVVFYAAANAANGNGASTGDRIYAATLRVAAAGAPQRPSFTSESVADAFTGRPGLAAGAWVTITGTDLAAQEAHWSPASTKPLETKLGGVTVKVNDVAAALSFVSPTKITLLAPAGTPEGPAPVVIERDGRPSEPVTVTASAVLPAVYSVRDPNGRGFFAAVTTAGAGTGLGLINGRGWLLGKPDVDSRAARGVYPGEEIDIYTIGLGRTDPEFPTDRLFAGNFAVVKPLTVRFGEVSVTPSLAALVSPGLYFVRVKAPDSLPAGDVPLVLEINGSTSASNVLLNIQSVQ